MLSLKAVELRYVSLPLRFPFETSFARETVKECLLVRAFTRDTEGWGEVVAMSEPLYNEETLTSCWHILKEYLIPATLKRTWTDPEEWANAMQPVRRNYMARAGLEAALWEIHAQQQNQSLAQLWGGIHSQLQVGISLGIESHLDQLLPQIEAAIDEGYARVKLKIKPGWDTQVLKEVRARWPNLPLQVDANSAYRLQDLPIFQELDDHNLILIEQPLDHDDIVDHAQLQKHLKTPLCLDESIDNAAQCRRALDLESCRIINIKPGRVGGFAAARAIHDLCQSRHIPCWVGGMLETGIGRLQNLALASLPNFTLPGDLSASRRYFDRDLIEPEVTLKNGKVDVPQAPAHHFLHWPTLEKATTRVERF